MITATRRGRPPVQSEKPGHLGLRRILAINAMWLGQGAHWPPITFALLPLAAALVVGQTPARILLIGHISAAGNILALLAPILAGWLSDHTRTRWGRRRPWIAAGAAVNLIGLGWLAFAGSSLDLALAYLLVQLSFNLAGGAYAAIIPDVVPADDRGRASGLLGMMQALGAVIGLGAVVGVLATFHESRTGLIAGYSCLAAIMLTTTVISLVAAKEPAVPAHSDHQTPSVSRTALVAAAAALIAIVASIVFLLSSGGGWLYAVAGLAVIAAVIAGVAGWRLAAVRDFFVAFRNRDFFWTFATRALVMMGIATIQPLLAFYFRDVVGVAEPSTMAGIWGLTLLAGAIVPAAVGGYLSDRWGRRKVFVYLSGGLQALVASVLLFGLVRDLTVIFVLGVIFGIGYGMYTAVDWAIACDVLPDREHSSGRDMGLWHIAFTLPTALAPSIFTPLLVALNEPGHLLIGVATGDNLGYRVIFAGAAIWFLLGTLFVTRIRGVR